MMRGTSLQVSVLVCGAGSWAEVLVARMATRAPSRSTSRSCTQALGEGSLRWRCLRLSPSTVTWTIQLCGTWLGLAVGCGTDGSTDYWKVVLVWLDTSLWSLCRWLWHRRHLMAKNSQEANGVRLDASGC